MNRLCSLLLCVFSGAAFAQQPPPATPPPRPAPIISPEVKENRDVTFRLRAPNAKEVLVRGQWAKEPLTLTLGADGNWSGEATAVPPGVWEYSLVVDGLAMIDPDNSALKPMRNPRASILHIPDSPPAAWDFQDVAHGAVHQHSYLSKALGRPRELVVYTPAGYEAGKIASYPLLVLQHGSGDNEQTWVAHGKAHWILDNLIAAGKARPMIVLMINGHPFPPGANTENRGAAMEAFRRELLEDALPLVEERYRVSKSRDRARDHGPQHGRRAIAHRRPRQSRSLRVGRLLQRRPWRRAHPPATASPTPPAQTRSSSCSGSASAKTTPAKRATRS